jgi:hypothetical protein
MSQPSPARRSKPAGHQRHKQKTADRAAPLIAAAVGPSERIWVGARVETGLSPWWGMVTAFLILVFRNMYYMALTDHYVVLCEASSWNGQPTRFMSATRRDQVRAADFRPGVVYSTFSYVFPGRTRPSRVRVHRAFRPEIESILGALGALGPARPQGQQPYPGPRPHPVDSGQPYAPQHGTPPPYVTGQGYPPQHG